MCVEPFTGVYLCANCPKKSRVFRARQVAQMLEEMTWKPDQKLVSQGANRKAEVGKHLQSSGPGTSCLSRGHGGHLLHDLFWPSSLAG